MARLYIRVPPEATLKGLATEIAKETGYHVAPRLRTTEVWEIALHRLAQRGITVLWVDEAHHLLGGKENVEVRQRLKSLMQGDKAMALIVSGIPLLDANIRQDCETDRRFLARVVLGPIQTEQERGKLREFFWRCCELARLAPPRDPYLVERLEAVTHSSLGGSIEMFQKAIYRALRRRGGQLALEFLAALPTVTRETPETVSLTIATKRTGRSTGDILGRIKAGDLAACRQPAQVGLANLRLIAADLDPLKILVGAAVSG